MTLGRHAGAAYGAMPAGAAKDAGVKPRTLVEKAVDRLLAWLMG